MVFTIAPRTCKHRLYCVVAPSTVSGITVEGAVYVSMSVYSGFTDFCSASFGAYFFVYRLCWLGIGELFIHCFRHFKLYVVR